MGDPHWIKPRSFKVSLETSGKFEHVQWTPQGHGTPMVTTKHILWEGTVGNEWIDISFSLSGTRLILELGLDIDGDGNPMGRTDREQVEMVFIRQCKIHPPENPFAITSPSPNSLLVPSMNFRLWAVQKDPFGRVSWIGGWYIEDKEAEAGCTG